MSNNAGKGDFPRPLSVDQRTFADNWDRIFTNTDTCEYSGLLSTASYEEPSREYTELLASGHFWEFFPGLTGNWYEDKDRWTHIMLMRDARK
jgi:hypothetical protein